jgi:peptidoglycan/LPS O-acetylase OafA/YrhL
MLDIARGLAAISIGIFHYKIFYAHNLSINTYILENQPYYNYIRLVYDYGWIAVQFFFLLSGFIFFKLYLKKIYEKKISFYNFAVLRISRLYPLHFITLIIVLLIYFLLDNNNFQNPIRADLEHFIYNLFLIHEWGLSKFSSFNEPSWSISVELLMYLIFFFHGIKD